MADPAHRERGLRAALNNPRVSEQAKQRDREILENEFGESPGATEPASMETTTSHFAPPASSNMKSAASGETGSSSGLYDTSGMEQTANEICERRKGLSASMHAPKQTSSRSKKVSAGLDTAPPENMGPPAGVKKGAATATTGLHASPVESSASSAATGEGMSKSTRSAHGLGANAPSEMSGSMNEESSEMPTQAQEEFEGKDVGNVMRGLKAAINNPRVSEKAKERDRNKLHDLGESM
ncbi:hypothetical protein B0H63DRAFT_552655 [Podospora didyma]|uniref:Conidiation-specific protein 6 n=1 Tax=Podospora didyma TaxID=330526 RepID=A0AAE0N5V7_9PEZI|nr:hypothetical protein B0H63DRAFT_552655 [Podospora didyma]